MVKRTGSIVKRWLARQKRLLLQFSHVIFRVLHIRIIPASLRRGAVERKKIVVYQAYSIAILQGITHLVPLSASVILITLNLRGQFFGDVSSSTITALQFVAKVLEILIQASLAASLFTYVRHFLFGPRSLPFGLLLAPHHVTSISYCWSIDLWGPLTQKYRSSWKLYPVLGLIPFTIMLAAVVGPSSAVLLIPRPSTQLLTTMHYLLGYDDIGRAGDTYSTWKPSGYATIVNSTYGEWHNNSIPESVFPQLTSPLDAHDCSELRLYGEEASHKVDCSNFGEYNQTTSFDTGWSSGYYTMSTDYSAKILKDAQDRLTATGYSQSKPELYLEAVLPQPLVHYSCMFSHELVEPTQTLMDETYFQFPNGSQAQNNSIAWSGMGSNMFYSDTYLNHWQALDVGYNVLSDWVLEKGKKAGRFAGEYVLASPAANAQTQQSLLYAHVSLYNDTASAPLWLANTVGCVVNVYWLNQTVLRMNRNSTLVDFSTDHEGMQASHEGPVAVSTSWLLSILEQAKVEVSRAYHAERLAYVLNFGLAMYQYGRTGESYNASTTATLYQNDSCYRVVPWEWTIDPPLTQEQCIRIGQQLQNQTNGIQDSDIIMTGGNWTNVSLLPRVAVNFQLTGYGYGSKNTTVWLSMTVLVVYVAMAASTFLWTTISGRTSNSWDSMGELLTLGLYSPRPELLGDATAGVETFSTYRKNVSVKVDDKARLQLVFDDDTNVDRSLYSDIEVGKAY